MQKHWQRAVFQGRWSKLYCLKKYLLTSAGHLKLNSKCRQQFKCLSWKMFSKNIAIYNLFIASSISRGDRYMHSIKLSFLTSHANATKVDQTCELPA